jgi:hypothetical protein
MPRLNRDYAISLLLLASCALLGSGLVLEWMYFKHKQQAIERQLAKGAVANDPGVGPELEEFELPPVTDYVEMVQRPLFAEGRKPLDEATEAMQAGAEAQKTPLNLKLMGVILTPEGEKALLVNEQGKYKRAKKDEEVNSWRLLEIEADRVVLQQDSERQVLPLLKPKPKTAVANQPVATPHRAPPPAPAPPQAPPGAYPPAVHPPPEGFEAVEEDDEPADEDDSSDEDVDMEAE